MDTDKMDNITDIRIATKYEAIQKDPLQSWESNLRDFVNGTAAMFMLHPGDLTFLFEMGLDPKTLGLAPLPAGPHGQRAAQIPSYRRPFQQPLQTGSKKSVKIHLYKEL